MTTVSIDGLFAPTLEGGLESDRLRRLRGELTAAHRELMERRHKDLGFYDAPLREGLIRTIGNEVKRLRSLADDLVVLGIGGSSLGGQALSAALLTTTNRSGRTHFVDNVDPDTLGHLLESLDPARTAVAAITKSGSTVETLAQLLIVRRWFAAALGKGEARSRMTFVTDPEKGLLRDLSRSEGIRAFEIPSNVGGRYSVLTPVGLLPAGFAGVDIARVLQGAASMLERVTNDDVLNNPACLFGAGAVLAQRELGRTCLVMMPYADTLRVLGSWFVQLWAESLGKRLDRKANVVHAGQTPIAAVGATDQHAQLQLFVEGPRDKAVTLVSVEKRRRVLQIPDDLEGREEVAYLCGRDLGELLEAERRATRAALLGAGVPVLELVLPMVSEECIGGLLVLLEASCACAGLLMGVDPFDQPGVEEGKRMAFGLLGRAGFEAYADRVKAREAVARNTAR